VISSGAFDDARPKVAAVTGSEKTIIFAKNQAHADFIERAVQCEFIRITKHIRSERFIQTEHAQSLIEISRREQGTHIAISVDCSTRH